MISLVFAAALLAGAPAAAEAPAAAPAKAEKPSPNTMVCKKEEVLGSKMKQRVCLTQADWDQRRADGQDELKKAQSLRPSEAH